MTELASPDRQALNLELKRHAWELGDLRYKLHASQLEVYEEINTGRHSRFVLEIARRWGKTWLLAVIAVETCLRKPGCRVVYGAPTVKDLEEFILPTLEAIFDDAPEGLRGAFNAGNGHWEIENGSYLHLFGCDDKRKANRGRGSGAELAILDECGFIAILRYVIRAVMRPQLLHSGGKMLLGSTPAEEPAHDFTAVAEKAEARGSFVHRTIYDNPRLTPEHIVRFIEDDAKDEGLTPEQYALTDDFRREYLAERVVNKLSVVVPEWADTREKLLIEVKRPEFFRGMVMADPGGSDPHAFLFGYWHFDLAKFVIEDELLLRNGENTREVAEVVKAKEKELWGVNAWEGTLRGARENIEPELLKNLPEWMSAIRDKEAPKQPYWRWCDTHPPEFVRDMYLLHGLAFIPTLKDDKQLQVNNLRVMIQSGNVAVNPRCVNLDRHLRTTIWKDHKRKTYERRHGEHGDLLDCFVYGARNLDRHNPYPPGWGDRIDLRIRAPKRETQATQMQRALLGGSPLAEKLLQSRRLI